MAVRGWGGTPATAFGIAAGTGAAQLGFGYGLGIISWTPPDPGAGGAPATLWAASLGWATWIAATSTIAGAVGAGRLARRSTVGAHARNRRRPGGILSALAAALGALVTVLLVAVPARAAVPTDTTTPQTVAAAYTGAGLLVGFLVAIWAQRSPPAAANIFANIGWLWTLAVVAVVDGVLAGRGMASAQLGFWQPATDRPGILAGDHLSWLAVVLSLGSALVVGALAARRAARSTYRRVGAAASGAAGPLLVAVAYLLTVPRLPELRAEQLTAQFVAAYAVVTGIAGSVLVAALAQRRDAATGPGGGAAATGATAAEVAATDAVATIDATAVEVGTTAAEGVEASPVAGTALPADGAAPGGSAPDAAEVDASAAGAGSDAPADPAAAPAADAGPPRRRANRSASGVPRQRREEPTTGAESGTGSTDAPDGSVVEPGPAGPDDDSRTSPAAGAATEPRSRGRRAAARRPRD
ncbi:hypothetical protein [Micromonospora echinospora]|uniref:hypothetical protein n=1 Tax=Micromonospora echinospora TaxID=1877 RepID=UPI003A86DEBD